jgi:amyloid beta precursor protein binding protein 1
MTALTATYLELQRIYRDKAERDLVALEAHVRQVEQDVAATDRVATSLIRSFAKNARNLRSYTSKL